MCLHAVPLASDGRVEEGVSEDVCCDGAGGEYEGK